MLRGARIWDTGEPLENPCVDEECLKIRDDFGKGASRIQAEIMGENPIKAQKSGGEIIL